MIIFGLCHRYIIINSIVSMLIIVFMRNNKRDDQFIERHELIDLIWQIHSSFLSKHAYWEHIHNLHMTGNNKRMVSKSPSSQWWKCVEYFSWIFYTWKFIRHDKQHIDFLFSIGAWIKMCNDICILINCIYVGGCSIQMKIPIEFMF